MSKPPLPDNQDSLDAFPQLHFDELLRSYIRRAGMTYEQLSKLANISYDTVRNWTRGTAVPRKWQDVIQMARALGLTANETDLLLRSARHPRLANLLRTHPKEELLADWRTAMSAEAVDRAVKNRAAQNPIRHEQPGGDAGPSASLSPERFPLPVTPHPQLAVGGNAEADIAVQPSPATPAPNRVPAVISIVGGFIVLLLLVLLLTLRDNPKTNEGGTKPTPTLSSALTASSPTAQPSPTYATQVDISPAATSARAVIPAKYMLRGVYMVSPTKGWIVGTSDTDNEHGVILEYDGGAWVERAISDVHAINGIAMYSADEGWAVGAHGDTLHYHAGQWRKSELIADAQLNSVSLTAADDGWAVGNTGTILQLHAGKWTNYSQFVTDENLRTVYMISANEGWAVGGEDGGGVFLHYQNGKWSREVAKIDGADIKGYPATLYMVSSAQGWAFCNGGYIMEYGAGKWSIVQHAPTDKLIRASFKLSASEGWATGSDGLILHYNGVDWQSVSEPTKANLNGIYVLEQGEGWAVGEQGTILHYKDGAWSIYLSPHSSLICQPLERR